MKLRSINDDTTNISGTSLKGYVTTTKANLVKAFGEPNEYYGDKVNLEWRFVFETDGADVVATVYDWKNYDYRLTDDEVYEFHVGGRTHEVVPAIVSALIQRGGKVFKAPTSSLI